MTQGDGVGGSFSDNIKTILKMNPQPRPPVSFLPLGSEGCASVVIRGILAPDSVSKGKTVY